ncbi:MAG: ATP-binding protein [Armatimonadetes bacterium]|nr:ATP-binding protein [Armatimonadota bacterium]
MRDLLRLLLAEALNATPPEHTRRDIRLPSIPGKGFAVIGVRRSGKTTFLWQCLADRLAAGAPRESLLLLSLEDDRLAGMQVGDLAWLVEEYYRVAPSARRDGSATLFLDEIQAVPGWELFARRMIDSERISLFLSGSSAKLLSSEVATSMRGRAMDVIVHPFGFREALRHASIEPLGPWNRLGPAERSELDARLRRYLVAGGFPEAQGAPDADRVRLLRGYVDMVVLRDVVERHGMGNIVALRALQRQLLASPGGAVSVQKSYDALRSAGIAVSKDTVHACMGYLEDAFLIRTVWVHTASERRRHSNPRKCYPVDPGLIAAYERSGRLNTGHALETAVMLELERRGWDIGYVRTPDGYEVDFIATRYGSDPLLIQVCAQADDATTLARELRALASAMTEEPEARAILVTLDASPPPAPLPVGVEWAPAAQFLLYELPER